MTSIVLASGAEGSEQAERGAGGCPGGGHGEEPVVTLALRSMPRRMTIQQLLDEVDSTFPAKGYNFVLMPWDARRSSNMGYSFINFTNATIAAAFKSVFHDREWSTAPARRCCIRAAEVQGLPMNVAFCAVKLSMQLAEKAECLLILDADGRQVSLETALRRYCSTEMVQAARRMQGHALLDDHMDGHGAKGYGVASMKGGNAEASHMRVMPPTLSCGYGAWREPSAMQDRSSRHGQRSSSHMQRHEYSWDAYQDYEHPRQEWRGAHVGTRWGQRASSSYVDHNPLFEHPSRRQTSASEDGRSWGDETSSYQEWRWFRGNSRGVPWASSTAAEEEWPGALTQEWRTAHVDPRWVHRASSSSVDNNPPASQDAPPTLVAHRACPVAVYSAEGECRALMENCSRLGGHSEIGASILHEVYCEHEDMGGLSQAHETVDLEDQPVENSSGPGPSGEDVPLPAFARGLGQSRR